jgi:hypothetical protein
MSDLFHQTRPDPPYSPEVTAFADRLEAIMGDGTHDLDGIAAALNMTPAALSAYLAELANA